MIRVTDHAVIRLLEREHGFDVDGVRQLIAGRVERAVERAAELDGVGNVTVVLGGIRYLVRERCVITVLPPLGR